jgi:hypothetical protein
MTLAAHRIRTAEIGNELARLIRDGAKATLNLKVVQFGGLEKVATAPVWSDILPAVFVNPEETTYAEEGGLDIGNIQPIVTETFRIVHFFGYAPQDDIQSIAASNARVILKPLTDDAGLATLGASIRADTAIPGAADQISWSALSAVEWYPDEQVFLTDAQQRVKVVTFRWLVRWYNRM